MVRVRSIRWERAVPYHFWTNRCSESSVAQDMNITEKYMECRLNYLSSFAFLWFLRLKRGGLITNYPKINRGPQEIKRDYMVAGLI